MKILFLGGTSYLGRELIKRLKKQSHFKVSAFVRSPESEKKIKDLGINIISDLENVDDQDVVMNLIVDYGKNKELSEIMAINVDYPLNLIKKIKTKTIINFSSALDKNVSHYAYSKKILEEQLIKNSKENQNQVINLRIQHFYGPHAPSHNFVAFLVTKMLANEELALTDCLQRRDFIYTEDLIDAVELILKNTTKLNQIENIDIGSGEAIKLLDFVETVKTQSGSKSKIIYGAVPKRPNEPMELVADITNLIKLGWKPKTSLAVGIKNTLEAISEVRILN